MSRGCAARFLKTVRKVPRLLDLAQNRQAFPGGRIRIGLELKVTRTGIAAALQFDRHPMQALDLPLTRGHLLVGKQRPRHEIAVFFESNLLRIRIHHYPAQLGL